MDRENIPLLDLLGCFWCPQRLPGQWPLAHYKVLPCTILGLSLVSLRMGTGEKGKMIPLQNFGSTCGNFAVLGFCPQFQHPSVSSPFPAHYFLKDAPFHILFLNTATAANSYLEQIKGRSRNISETSPRDPFNFPSLSWRCISLFLEPQVSAWMGQKGHTNNVHSCRANPHIPPSSTFIQLQPLPEGKCHPTGWSGGVFIIQQ